MQKAGLPPVLIWDCVSWVCPLRRSLGKVICRLISSNSLMRRDPLDRDTIASGHKPGAHLDGWVVGEAEVTVTEEGGPAQAEEGMELGE